MTLSLVSPLIDSVEDPKDISPRALWQMEIEAAQKELEKFHERAVIANERFIDERDINTADQKWFNIYYANTNILKSALYADLPEPSVSRRYEDYRDDVARVAALILQRALKQDINDPQDQFDAVMRQATQDRLIPGMSCAWLRLETQTEASPSITNDAQSTQPAPNDEGGFPVPGKLQIKDQSVVVDYVYWKDFLYSPCRTWGERRWVARKTYLTRQDLTKRFGRDKATLCSLDHTVIDAQENNVTPIAGKDVFKKATVWEIWDRTTRKVHWYAPGFPEKLLDTRDDFLGLQSFEPCPEPMLANITTSSTVPRPDYYMIQDQYNELNNVNARISLLVQACKVVGVYDASAAALQSILTGNENTMVPVPNWSQFSEKGGMKGSVDWIPLEVIVAALQRLYEARAAIKGQIYELTGISDIVRGDSKASETLGAQKIKQQFASIRIKTLQSEVARFASDILRIRGEIMVKHFVPATLISKSGIIYTDNDDYVVDAVVLLKSEEGFNWRIKVQSDSMAQADYEAEKEDRIKFMSMVTGYMSQALPIAGQIPELKPVILGLLKWGIAGFKGAADIEGMIDKQLAQLEGKPPPPPKPDPQEIAAQAKLKQTEMQGQLAQQKGQQEMQKGQQEMAHDQQTAQLETQKQQQEMQLKREEHQAEMAMRREEMEMDRLEHEQQMQFQREKAGIDLQTNMQKSQIDLQTHQQTSQQKVQDAMVQSDINERKGEQQLEQSDAAHRQQLAQAKSKEK